MVAMVFLHMCRVFLTGAYKKPREFNWVIGVVLLLVTLFLSFTGYLLPWDQLAFWAITVGTSIAAYAPLIGKQMQFVLLGDTTVGQEALLRFYVLHVAVLPAVLVLLMAIHFWRIRKDGGLSRPGEAAAAAAVARDRGASRRTAEERSTACRALCADRSPRSATCPTIGVQLAEPADRRAVRLRADGGADPGGVAAVQRAAGSSRSTSCIRRIRPRRPWYFLGLQEMVSYSAFWGGIGIPGHRWWRCCCWCRTSTAAPRASGSWFAASACWPTRSSSPWWCST